LLSYDLVWVSSISFFLAYLVWFGGQQAWFGLVRGQQVWFGLVAEMLVWFGEACRIR